MLLSPERERGRGMCVQLKGIGHPPVWSPELTLCIWYDILRAWPGWGRGWGINVYKKFASAAVPANRGESFL